MQANEGCNKGNRQKKLAQGVGFRQCFYQRGDNLMEKEGIRPVQFCPKVGNYICCLPPLARMGVGRAKL